MALVCSSGFNPHVASLKTRETPPLQNQLLKVLRTAGDTPDVEFLFSCSFKWTKKSWGWDRDRDRDGH